MRKRLLEEIRLVSEEPKDTELEKLTYLDAVIQETLRLYCAAPGGLPRCAPPGGATLAGVFIPGGITVSTQLYSLHRDPQSFPDPDT